MTLPRPSRMILTAGVLVAGLLLAACASSSDTAASGDENSGDSSVGVDAGVSDDLTPAGDRPLSQDVAGRNFVSTKTTGFDLVDDSLIHLAFVAEDQISLDAGCNRLFGSITWDTSGVAHFSAPTLASTMMACDEALMEQDTFLSGLLADGVDVDVRNTGELFLTSGDITIEFAHDLTGLDEGTADLGQPTLEGDAAHRGD